MQVLGRVVTAVGYHTFWEIAAEGGVGSRVLVTDELLDSKPLPFCFAKNGFWEWFPETNYVINCVDQEK